MPIVVIAGLAALAIYAIVKSRGSGFGFTVGPAAGDSGGVLSDLASSVTEFGAQAYADVSSFGSNAGTAGGDDPIAIATDLLKQLELFSATVYPDPPGQSEKFSIGYGHQIRSDEMELMTATIDEDQGTQMLSEDIQSAAACVSSNVGTQLTPNQTAALISFAYNVGCPAFSGSTLLQLVNQGDIDAAAAEFAKWKYTTVGGRKIISTSLIARRERETNLFEA